MAERGFDFQFTFNKVFSDEKMKTEFVNFINKIYSNFQVNFKNQLKFFEQFLNREDLKSTKNFFKQKSIPHEESFQQLVINKYFKKHKSKSQVKVPRKSSKIDNNRIN